MSQLFQVIFQRKNPLGNPFNFLKMGAIVIHKHDFLKAVTPFCIQYIYIYIYAINFMFLYECVPTKLLVACVI